MIPVLSSGKSVRWKIGDRGCNGKLLGLGIGIIGNKVMGMDAYSQFIMSLILVVSMMLHFFMNDDMMI